VAGDVCAAARGDGRRWAAERLGLAGVVVEADTALGGVAVLASVGTYGGARTAAKTSVEAVKAAGRVAEGYRAAAAARAVGLLYGLWQGALLGWDVYLAVSRGEVPLEAVGAAVAAVGGRLGGLARLVHGLASGGLLLMHLGEVGDGRRLGYGECVCCLWTGCLSRGLRLEVLEVFRWWGWIRWGVCVRGCVVSSVGLGVVGTDGCVDGLAVGCCISPCGVSACLGFLRRKASRR